MTGPLDNDAQDQGAKAARNRRNIAMALALAAFVALVFVVTIVKLSGNAG